MLRLLAQNGVDIVPQGLGFGIVLSLLTLLWSIQRRDRKFQNQAIRKAQREARTCEWRLDVVIGACRRAGVEISESVWGPPPWAGEEDDDE